MMSQVMYNAVSQQQSLQVLSDVASASAAQSGSSEIYVTVNQDYGSLLAADPDPSAPWSADSIMQ